MCVLFVLYACICWHHKSSYFLLQDINFAFLDIQHVFEVADLPLLSAFLLCQLRYLLTLFRQQRFFFFQTKSQGIHLCA